LEKVYIKSLLKKAFAPEVNNLPKNMQSKSLLPQANQHQACGSYPPS